VRTTWLQRLPFVRKYSRALLPLMPRAFAALDLRPYEVAVSITTAFAKSLSPRPGTRHVCYCNTPPRYLWDLADEYLDHRFGGRLLRPVVTALRAADLRAAETVDQFVANSDNVAQRIRRAYGRDSIIIYPPVNTTYFQPAEVPTNDFYLVVSRLVRYKRIDLAVAACNRLRRKLVIVGEGPERARLQDLAGPTITFLGKRSDEEIRGLYANCRAFLFPGLEDFGISPVEAQSAGRPVVAFGRGGATETVLDGVTGMFFPEQTVDSLVEAVMRLEASSFDPVACRQNALRFDASVFRDRLSEVIQRVAS
jgi:glycosyltransferase involved in cell wall biosynthesis